MLFKRKSAKVAAYEALIKYNVTTLPVPTRYSGGIYILSMQLLADFYGESVEKYYNTFGYRGFVCHDTERDTYGIFINEEDSESLKRWSISVAIGIIENEEIAEFRGISISAASGYINDFTYVYTCPDCVLRHNQIISAEEIIKVCGVPFNKAREKSKRLRLLLKPEKGKIATIEKVIRNLIILTRD